MKTLIEPSLMTKPVVSQHFVGKACKQIALWIHHFSSFVTPEVRTTEANLADGRVVRKFSTRAWQRHSALISASFDSSRGRE